MKSIIKLLFVIVLYVLIPCTVCARLTVSNLFADGMVLQRNTRVALWGLASPNEKFAIQTNWNGKSYQIQANEQGKWKAFVETGDAGGPYEIILSGKDSHLKLKDVLLGEVWLCSGQSNMDMPVKGFTNQAVQSSAQILDEADEPKIRLFQVKRRVSSKPLETVEGSWQAASFQSVADFSAVGYLFAKRLYQKTKVPIGIIQSAWGGTMIQTWMSAETLKPYDTASNYIFDHQKNQASALFNGMIQPLIGYTLKGVIWYQGESNRARADEYLNLFPAMVKDWRRKWGRGDFPFYYVQIAPYHYAKDGKDKLWQAPYMREIQQRSLQHIKNAEMVVTLDVGNAVVIHPPDKQTVAFRLANIALTKLYGITTQHTFPYYQNHQVKGNVVELTFTNSPNGLTSHYQPITLFEIAGEDKIFYPAKARITSLGIEVWSAQVKIPSAVRYAYKPFVQAEIFNTEGLPLTSFRTDNWSFK